MTYQQTGRDEPMSIFREDKAEERFEGRNLSCPSELSTPCLISVFAGSKIRVLDNSSKFKFLIIVIVIILAAGGYWYWSKSKQDQKEAPTKGAPTLGSEIFDRTQSPLEGQVPDANPFKNQKNPLDSLYKNPFE